MQVVYGVVGLKTHAKMLLITRRDKRSGQLQRYGHLSTGNYNARSARLYTDLSHLTCDAAITEDMDAVFRLADRISVLVNGRLICTGLPDEVRQDAEVRRAYLGDHL